MEQLTDMMGDLSTDNYNFYIEDYFRYCRNGSPKKDDYEVLQGVKNTIISKKKDMSFFVYKDIKFFSLVQFRLLFENYPEIYRTDLMIILIEEMCMPNPFNLHKEYDKLTLVINALLEMGADPNKLSKNSIYPLQMLLMNIIETGSFDNLQQLFSILLSHGANAELLIKNGVGRGISIRSLAHQYNIPL